MDAWRYGSHPHGNSGHVYFIQGVDGGPIKIGFTRYGIAKRLLSIQPYSPVQLVVLCEAAAPWWAELEIHKLLADHRLHGEWFTDCAEVRNVITTLLEASSACEALAA